MLLERKEAVKLMIKKWWKKLNEDQRGIFKSICRWYLNVEITANREFYHIIEDYIKTGVVDYETMSYVEDLAIDFAKEDIRRTEECLCNWLYSGVC